MKCVLIIDHTLPMGLIANTAAVLSISVGALIPEIIGKDLYDQQGHLHRGITTIPLPILKGTAQSIRDMRTKIITAANAKVQFVDFCDAAQSSVSYDQYEKNLLSTAAEEINYLGIAVWGPDKPIKSLTGSIALLR